MDRALNLEILTSALGQHARLPNPTELQQLLAAAEVALFTQQAEVPDSLLDTAWYLQSIVSSRADLQLLSFDRRRQAHQVSGHIFDLALQAIALETDERLRYTFAAQVGYLGGALTPNASALARRAPIPVPPYEWTSPGNVSMEVGVLLLALNRSEIYPLLRERGRQLDALADRLDDLSQSPYGAVNGVVRGALDLMDYLTYGRTDALERAGEWFQGAVASTAAEQDVDSRWVAAHLVNRSGDLRDSSVWSVLPPDLPAAARAMTLGDPPVLQLWPPQLSFLEDESTGVRPLDSSVKRIALSFPTSAGKSLLAQVFVLTHLTSNDDDVCVVAPTHSLCRELAMGLERRLRTLGYQLYKDGPLGLFEEKPPDARVVVLTPEKLAARLRSDPEALLQEFGMFVIDEAHLVADGDRGWRLEETISFLHHLTKGTRHRLLVLSAALGNEFHITSWLDAGSGVVSKHETWRGPRRLNAVYATEADWSQGSDEPAKGVKLPRRRAPLNGVVHLKIPSGNVIGRFAEPVGELVLRLNKVGKWTRDDQTTLQRVQIVPLIVHVSASGPVLVVEVTRTAAQRLAEEVSAQLEGEAAPEAFGLIDTVRTRLGDNHPLTRVLAKGVAFHHSALPVDIQSEIEDAARSGLIRCLVSTTTLVEGVNLPFKTVVVANRGFRGAEGEVQLIDAPRLLNAIGRAGRAGRETEGWLILTIHADFAEDMFEDLERTGGEIEVRSSVASRTVLEALSRIEAESAAGVDSILSNHDAIADGFISFIWFVADSLQELEGAVTAEAVKGAIRDTLAWHQVEGGDRDQLLRVADIAFASFSSQPEDRRRRWARTGTSLPSAATLDSLSQQVLQARQSYTGPGTPSDFIKLILEDGRLSALLGLAENARPGFKPSRTAPRGRFIDVDLEGLLGAWVSGSELEALAEEFLGEIADADYRYEQLTEFIASVFEHHLPWMLGIIIRWVNQNLEAAGSLARLPEDLPGLVHFGVGSHSAISLMLAGVRSRRVAIRVARAYEREVAPDDLTTLRQWLAGQEIAAWRERFEASPTQLLDLLAFTRAREARLVRNVLSGDAYRLPFTTSRRHPGKC